MSFSRSLIPAVLESRRGRLGLVTVLALLAATLVYARAQAASCASGFPLVAPPSCFEAGDGDTAASAGKTDWQSPGLNVVTFKDDNRDTQFSGGDKENDPGAWTIIPAPLDPPQGISPNQNDVLAGAIAGELVPDTDSTKADHVFVYGAFERLPQAGNTTTAFELNQLQPIPATATQPKLPQRSEGDLFITFDGGPDSVVVRMCVWHGDAGGETSDDEYGWYSLPGFGAPGVEKLEGSGNCTRLDDDAAGRKATAKVNGSILAPGAPLTPAFGASLGVGSFGEMAVDLTRALDKLASAGTADQCFGFGAMMLHTRSSDAGTASPKDFVEPQSIPKLTNCALELEKKVARDDGGALTFQDADTAGAAVLAHTTDDLQYRFEVKNPSDFPFPQASIALTELTSASCDAAPSGPTNPDGSAVDGTLNKNETWIYTCTRSGPLPAGTLLNEAKVTGTVNAKEVASATDKAYAKVIDPSIDVEKTGPAKAYSGDDLTFTITAENTGDDPISNVVITETQCDPASTNTPDSGDTHNTGVLDTDETWSWECTVPDAAGTSLTNTAEVDGDDSLGENVDDDDSVTVTLISPSIQVQKTGPAKAYSGGDVTFTVTAENTGDDPITDVVITDTQCDPALSNTPDSGDTHNTGVLDTDETWSWSCTVKNATGTSLTNLAEVDGKDSLDGPVHDDDDATVTLITSTIDVVKTGPASVLQGGAISWTVKATNTGTDALTNIVITDPGCNPALSNTPDSGDAGGDGVMSVGETWTWTCKTTAPTSGSSVTNVATVTGKDPLGGSPSDEGRATTQLTAPPVTATAPQFARAPVEGESDFRQKARDCISKKFRLDVTGREIVKVTFTVDGKVRKVLTKSDASGRWSYDVNPALTDLKRHRVRAIVEYSPNSSVKSKTLSYVYQRCTCASRRNFRIRVRTRRADPVIRASVYVNGKRVQVVRGKRLKAPVKLIGLPKGRFTVKIVATTKSGRKITGERKYYTCRVKNKKKTIPQL